MVLVSIVMIAVAVLVGKLLKHLTSKIQDIDLEVKKYINEQKRKEEERDH